MAKILVVDDSPTILEMAKSILEENHHEAIIAQDGKEGLEKARGEKPDLIILDVMLPQIDGYRVCAMLKHDSRYKDIPVIMFTAKATEEDKKIGLDVCADGFVVKDFESGQFMEIVNKYIKK